LCRPDERDRRDVRPTRALVVLAGAVALLAAACGGDDDTDNSLTGSSTTPGDAEARTVDVDMVDNAYEPDTLTVEAGETVDFTFTNTGDVDHDAFIGDADAQMGHEEEMRTVEEEGDDDMGDHMGGEDDEDAIVVEPGETGEIAYTFAEPGTMEIGCHEPGHYEAGMKLVVTVS
jgi:uncharacterized cupredoxin-like copper-binding protein